MTVTGAETATTPLGEHESRAILLAAARHCIADTERDLVVAHRRRDHTASLQLTGQLALYIGLQAALGSPAPGMARAAA